MKSKKSSELEQIPGVGKAIARYLQDLGVNSINDLKGQDPEQLYLNMCDRQGQASRSLHAVPLSMCGVLCFHKRSRTRVIEVVELEK